MSSAALIQVSSHLALKAAVGVWTVRVRWGFAGLCRLRAAACDSVARFERGGEKGGALVCARMLNMFGVPSSRTPCTRERAAGLKGREEGGKRVGEGPRGERRAGGGEEPKNRCRSLMLRGERIAPRKRRTSSRNEGGVMLE